MPTKPQPISTPNPPPNPNPPNPIDLLWAHELRRENVELATRLKATTTRLAAAESAVDTLSAQLRDLDAQIQRCCGRNEELASRVDGIEGRVLEKIENIGLRVEGLECRFLEGVVVGSRLGAAGGKGPGAGLGGDCVVQGPGDEGPAVEEVLVPDSMPVASSVGLRVDLDEVMGKGTGVGISTGMGMGKGGGLSLTGSSTTSFTGRTVGSQSGSSTNRGEGDGWNAGSVEFGGEEVPTGNGTIDLFGLLRQGRLMPLEEYLGAAEGVRRLLLLAEDDRGFMEAFVRGLRDGGLRVAVEKEMGMIGWSWERLQEVVLRWDAEHADAPCGAGCRRASQISGDWADGHESKRRRKRARRFIPIVPADEEDVLIARAMMMGR
ncbi:uncharacterized protein BO97DRAFT_424835 [Aspergillus homomorphus CBS 101889]|uniref:Uncharacterized protein n=1 Tax=Aspergillus homomorphus (strain CBS 101889) TaxID=1450537 RepID=A0A395I197_ASPHC|nr:hypothetical protein BO97DRAFT_424835 [Aspergillus homomorphus CBS 101889]RAL12314.1 hypothetical protein BO97DRAFT_424835 [Aspergillus homomorphus CBS 101889]